LIEGGAIDMISIRDCIDYSDLTDEEVEVIAEHEHLPFATAAQLACCLAQSDEGAQVLRCILTDAVCDAQACGRTETLRQAQRALRQFCANHPA
jgi:hypothetical protein